LTADVVVPVPLHRQRERERGYNQAGLIARPLAKRLRLPYRPTLLVRNRSRPEKQMLSLEERWESVRRAFATQKGSRVDNLRVLLVDDVMTTGATLDACTRALREAGAKEVIGLTVARALRNSPPGGKL
jgi:ComF family protein